MVLDLLQFPIVSSFPKRTKTIRLQVGKITIINHMNNFLDFSRLFYLGDVYYKNLHIYIYIELGSSYTWCNSKQCYTTQ